MAKRQWREPSTLFDTEKRFFSGGVVLGTPCSKREKDVLSIRFLAPSGWRERAVKLEDWNAVRCW